MLKSIMLLVTVVLSTTCLYIGIVYSDPLGFIFCAQSWLGYYIFFGHGSSDTTNLVLIGSNR